jgi:hypothetical protein
LMFEVTLHPPSIEADLKELFAWLRSVASISIVDEDGEVTAW